MHGWVSCFLSVYENLYKLCNTLFRLGEVCSHVAALLFKVETACRLGYTEPSCTSLPCRWNNDFKTGVSTHLISYGPSISKLSLG